MSAPAPPSIPPRPVKQQAAAQGVSKLPEIPPRPISKRLERSVSPANYPGSPLNEPFVPLAAKPVDLPPRAPSVHHLPTPGEEGMEYANTQYEPQDQSTALSQGNGTQTRTIAEDLQLHAPKPSLPKASATAQVQGVTRTDIGRSSQDDLSQYVTRTRSRQSFSRPASAASGGNRRRSIAYEDEQGPAEIGLRVPINPLLGDVQAPTPSGMSPQATGESNRRHSRKKSGVEDFRPPDSYGLHGHGTIANSKFERDWYAKHPEQLEHEEGHGHGVYESIGSGRGSFALSSDELNKLVRNTASRGSGFGTSGDTVSYPDEQIGYMASEEYQRSQQNTPLPESLSRLSTRASQTFPDSPLRKTSFPADDLSISDIQKSRAAALQDLDGAGQDEVHHIDQPNRRYNKVTGGQESINETQEAKSYASHSQDEGHDYTVPILAEDEVAKHGQDFQHPAVSPKYERRSSIQDDDRSGAQTPTSRPASRPGSIYQMHSASHSLSRFISHQEEREHMHTPLEDVAEYEPLFDDNDERKSLTTAERFKRRPDALQKRFPSQDIWEDTPNSAMYQAEVSTPDLPSQVGDRQLGSAEAANTFEHPDAEAARKEEPSEADRERLISKEERLAKSKHLPHLRDDMPTKARPSIANRFPSQDIWEDTPDSSYLVTTVGSPQMEEETSPIDTKPPIPVRPSKSRLGEGASSAQIEPSVAPAIPARPSKRVHAVPPADAKLTGSTPLSKEVSPPDLRKVPSLPDRPKPQVPPRPARKAADDELTKVTSAGSNESTETQVPAKQKPQVPARPAGGNFASLKGNFMNDLNKKLGLGPRKEKDREPEPEVEAKPLEDARKSRARGPQRRAPAKAAAGEPKPMPQFSIFAAQPLWQIDEADELVTIIEPKSQPLTEVVSAKDHAVDVTEPVHKVAPQPDEESDEIPPPVASELAKNTAGESADPIATGDEENLEGELTRKTTATTIDGEQLDREDSRSATHILPASQQTTASDSKEIEDQLEKVATRELEAKAEDEPIKLRNEQVNAAAPEGTEQPSERTETEGKQKSSEEEAPVQRDPNHSKGDEKAQEPMNERDVTYNKLEEMTAKADGKLTAEEDPQAAFSSKKIMD